MHPTPPPNANTAGEKRKRSGDAGAAKRAARGSSPGTRRSTRVVGGNATYKESEDEDEGAEGEESERMSASATRNKAGRNGRSQAQSDELDEDELPWDGAGVDPFDDEEGEEEEEEGGNEEEEEEEEDSFPPGTEEEAAPDSKSRSAFRSVYEDPGLDDSFLDESMEDLVRACLHQRICCGLAFFGCKH